MLNVLAYSTSTPFSTGNGWDDVSVPFMFNQLESSKSQSELETEFGLVMQPTLPVHFVNTKGAPNHVMMSVTMSVSGNKTWNHPIAVGVFSQPVASQSYDKSTLLASMSYNYQHITGNTPCMTMVVPTMGVGQALYVAVGSYNRFDVNLMTVRFVG